MNFTEVFSIMGSQTRGNRPQWRADIRYIDISFLFLGWKDWMIFFSVSIVKIRSVKFEDWLSLREMMKQVDITHEKKSHKIDFVAVFVF